MLTIIGLYTIPTTSLDIFEKKLTFTWLKKHFLQWEWGTILALALTSCLTLPFRDIYSFCSLLRGNDTTKQAISSHRKTGRYLLLGYEHDVNVRRNAMNSIREHTSTTYVSQVASTLPDGAGAQAINFQSRQHTVDSSYNTNAKANANPNNVIADPTRIRADLSGNSLRNRRVPKQLERADDGTLHCSVSSEDTISSATVSITPQKRLFTSRELNPTSKRQRPNTTQSEEIATNPSSRIVNVSPVTPNHHDIGSENNGAIGPMVQYDPSDKDPFDGLMQYDPSLADPFYGMMQYDPSVNDPFYGMMQYNPSANDPFYGMVQYNSSPADACSRMMQYDPPRQQAQTLLE